LSLPPAEIIEKTFLVEQFLKQKLAAFEDLKIEISKLSLEVVVPVYSENCLLSSEEGKQNSLKLAADSIRGVVST
jgi:hypothetical protein